MYTQIYREYKEKNILLENIKFHLSWPLTYQRGTE